jgi:hypothetical protein
MPHNAVRDGNWRTTLAAGPGRRASAAEAVEELGDGHVGEPGAELIARRAPGLADRPRGQSLEIRELRVQERLDAPRVAESNGQRLRGIDGASVGRRSG